MCTMRPLTELLHACNGNADWIYKHSITSNLLVYLALILRTCPALGITLSLFKNTTCELERLCLVQIAPKRHARLALIGTSSEICNSEFESAKYRYDYKTESN